jgi:hypothetical protein
MKYWITFLGGLLVLSALLALGQSPGLSFPEKVEAGTAFSVPTTGSGQATLYIVGPGDAIRRNVQLGENLAFGSDDLHNAGHYVAFLVAGSSTQNLQFEVTPSDRPATLSFLARPSRLPVNLSNGLSGVVYAFDVFRNLILQPRQVSFELSDATGRTQSRAASTRDGVAWVKMNSAAKAGPAQFQAVAANIREKRVIQQVPGDPCTVKMSARESAPGSAQRIALETEPVRDCNGNSVPDGTIVTFTETYPGGQSTVDVPLKRGIARTEMPARDGATISVASGVVMGNEIRWGGGSRSGGL